MIELVGKNRKKTSLKERIRSFFVQEFFRNSIIRWLLFGAIFLNVVNWAILLKFIRPVDYSIILHYNVYFGVDLIGDWRQTYLLPAMGIVFWTINLFLAHRFYQSKERVASYMLLLAALMIQIGLIISSVGIAMINY